MMTAKSRLPVAFLDTRGESILALQKELDPKGFKSARFTSAADFLAVLACGMRFSLLLLSSQTDIVAASLAAVCEVTHTPAFRLEKLGFWSPLWMPAEALTRNSSRSTEFSGLTEGELRGWIIFRNLFSKNEPPLSWGEYAFLPARNIVTHLGQEIHLQSRQFDFALQLFQNTNELVTRDWLWKTLWNDTPRRDGARIIDTCAANLRKKLELRWENGFVLQAVYRKGYKLMATPV